MTASTSGIRRGPEYWAHKAHALLLPTPLEAIDPEGEAERAQRVREWLGASLQWRDDGLFTRCSDDAFGVHVPDVNGLSVEPPTDEVLLPPLLHPLTGMKSQEEVDETPRLDELGRLYERWINSIKALFAANEPLQGDDACGNYTKLWREWQRSLAEPENQCLARLPGHPLVRDHSVFAQRSIAAALVGARLEPGSHACLLNVHCGPVQSFITAARRTTDLWLGSYIVNFLSYQAVRSIARDCGPDSLIYPYLATLPLAGRDACEAVGKVEPAERSTWLRAAQPNRFVALVDSTNAEEIARAAAHAVESRWRAMADRVKNGIEEYCSQAGFQGFEQQIADFLEVDVVVQPWPNDGVGESYVQVFRLGRETLAAQRRVWSFVPGKGDTRPKCTQCGKREQLGPEAGRRAQNEWWLGLREGLRDSPDKNRDVNRGTLDFRAGEALCAVCLTKRLVHRFDFAGAEREFGLTWENRNDRVMLRFPSVASVASAPFRERLFKRRTHEAVRGWLDALLEALAAIDLELKFDPPGNLLPGLGPIGRGHDLLDLDGSWLYTRSYELETVENDFDLRKGRSELEPKLRRAAWVLSRIAKLLSENEDEPIRATPYYAVVVADVDKMGSWLDGSHGRPDLRDVVARSGLLPEDVVHRAIPEGRERPISPALHAEISRRQGELSSRVLHEIVEQRHLGRVVYSGGDDLLAFVPLHTVWSCLAEVNQAFRAQRALGSEVTVSAGVAILDWRDPLSLALRTAREAEKLAKARARPKNNKRSWVGITVGVRSGAPIELVIPNADAGELPALVGGLVAQKDPPHLLRPTAIEQLRHELDVLQHEQLTRAFRQRVTEIVGASSRMQPLLDRLLDERPPGEPGQVLDFLLLLRFLARNRGGIEFMRREADK